LCAEAPADLEARIDYRFRDKCLLERALTHRSASTVHMERLEFLGDAVLGAVIAARLCEQFPRTAEGDLTRMRAALVCRDGLLTVANDWKLSSFLRVGAGERNKNGAIKSPSIAANAVESLIGAIFLDGGWKAANALVLNAWDSMLAQAASADIRDAKTRLQEFTQSRGLGLPEYSVCDRGPECMPRFEAECYMNGKKAGKGSGGRKKTAEMNAAEQAWYNMCRENHDV